jgi:hypothetical protein
VFRPWRSEHLYGVLLVVLAAILFGVCYLETGQILESQIALGIDPNEAARFVSLAIVGEMLILTFWALKARRSLLAEGEVRLGGTTLLVSEGPTPMTRDTAELRSVASSPAGANILMLFSEGRIHLPGQWLPPGWKRTWRGWKTPDGAAVRLTRKTHPLLLALRALRPDLKPRLSGIALDLVLGLLCVLFPRIGTLPLYAEFRRMADHPDVDDVAMKDFQEGRYGQSCEAYRRALPDLQRDLYGSTHAAEFLLYCGDPKAAVRAAVGFDSQPFWPGSLDPEALARIQISLGRHAKAKQLLKGRPSYLLYVALADQGRRSEANEVLKQVAERDGLARVLLLRRLDRSNEPRQAANTLCANFLQHKPSTPSWLARVFESCILAGGVGRTREDPRFEPAIRALPGLRDDLIRFTEREAPETTEELKSVMAELARGQAG